MSSVSPHPFVLRRWDGTQDLDHVGDVLYLWFYANFSTPKARARSEQSRWGSLRVCSLSSCLSLCKVFRRLRVHGPGKHHSVIVRPRRLAGCKDL